jgi:hypothetical protein
MAWPHAESVYVRQNILTLKGDRQDFLEKPGRGSAPGAGSQREFNANDLSIDIMISFGVPVVHSHPDWDAAER